MTEQQWSLLERVKKLMFCVNDTRLLPQERGAAYYTMQKHRATLHEQGIETTILAGHIEVVSEYTLN